MTNLKLTGYEIAALLLLVVIGGDSYYGEDDGGEAREQLDRIPTEHLTSLVVKIRKAAGEVGNV